MHWWRKGEKENGCFLFHFYPFLASFTLISLLSFIVLIGWLVCLLVCFDLLIAKKKEKEGRGKVPSCSTFLPFFLLWWIPSCCIRCVIEDGTGEAQLYLDDDVIASLLQLSSQQWSQLKDASMNSGELSYQRAWRGEDNARTKVRLQFP